VGWKKDEAPVLSKPKFRIGGPDEALVILWARGDEPEEIAARFNIPLGRVEDAIRQHGHEYKRRRTRRPRRI
jgi:hypothetical protein